MMSTSLPDRICRIAADVFGLPAADITLQTSPQTIEHWDSVQHLNLVLALEQELGVEFQPEEVEEMKDIAAVVRIAQGKVSSS